jgi:hypothetical protein
MLYTQNYLERSINVFIKDDDPERFNLVHEAFTLYCKRVNEEIQSNFKEQGVSIIFEGRGGNTPLVTSHSQNEGRRAKPLPMMEQ